MLLICSHADEVEDVALLEQRCARMVECVEAELRKQSAAQRAELARLRESDRRRRGRRWQIGCSGWSSPSPGHCECIRREGGRSL